MSTPSAARAARRCRAASKNSHTPTITSTCRRSSPSRRGSICTRAPAPVAKGDVVAAPPADMQPGSPFGPGIASIAAYLHGCHMVSYNRLTEVFAGLLGLKISEGAIANMLARMAKPFGAQADKIAAHVRSSPVIASDETSARVCGKTWWQWVFSSASAVYHTIVPTRGKCVPDGVPRRRETEGLDLGPARRAMQACRGASVLPRPSDPRCSVCHRRGRHRVRARFQGLSEDGLRHRPQARRRSPMPRSQSTRAT